MKLAYWSPLSPRGTGIADYSEELLPYLADKGADIHLFVDDYEPDNRAIVEQFPWHPAREYEHVNQREAFDLNLYQIGNSSYHRYSLNAALRFPGVVVLHDLVLQHLFLGLSVERGDTALYLSEMKRAYGKRGAALGRQVAAALGSELLTSKFPLCERMIERSYGVLVLTRFMQRWLERRFGSIPVGKFIGRAPHHFAPAPLLVNPATRRAVDTPAEARRVLGLPEEAFLVASFGLATRAKRLDRALEGFRRFLATSAQATEARFLVVGDRRKRFWSHRSGWRRARSASIAHSKASGVFSPPVHKRRRRGFSLSAKFKRATHSIRLSSPSSATGSSSRGASRWIGSTCTCSHAMSW